jgi:predicted transposase YdaD
LAAKLGAATFLLLGLRYPADTLVQLFEGVKMIEESSTYQWLLERGRAEGRAEGKIQEARDLLLWQGSRKFGRPADAAEVARLESVQNLEQLKDLACRLLIVSTWQDLLVGI